MVEVVADAVMNSTEVVSLWNGRRMWEIVWCRCVVSGYVVPGGVVR